MAHNCGACGSADTSTGLGAYSCLDCGAVTDYEGNVVRPNPADGTVSTVDGVTTLVDG